MCIIQAIWWRPSALVKLLSAINLYRPFLRSLSFSTLLSDHLLLAVSPVSHCELILPGLLSLV